MLSPQIPPSISIASEKDSNKENIVVRGTHDA
jgi:hypothetical protein